MKYLKKYRLFESDSRSKDIEWIEECLLDLKDAGCAINIREYSVEVDDSPSDKKSTFSSFKRINVVPGIVIRILREGFFSEDKLIPIGVGDNLLMIDSYLRERGYVGYNAYDYDNPYSQSRYQVRVMASLKGVENKFETELSQFVKMLDRFQVNAPFDTIEVKYFRPEKESSSIKESRSDINESESDEEREYTIRDISREFEDVGLICSISKIRKDVELEDYWKKSRVDKYLEVYLSRPWNSENREIPGVGGYPGNLFFWYEIKDTVIRLVKWYYEVEAIYDPIDKNSAYRDEKDQSPLRFFASGTEIFVGFSKEEDFKGIGDFISFTSFRIMIRI